MSHRLGIAIAVVALLAVVGGAAVVFLDRGHAPVSKLELNPSPSPRASSAVGLAGTWVVDQGSEAGYRVTERFVGQSSDSQAVARTSAVTGQLVLEDGPTGLGLASASFSADISKLHSVDANATHGNAVRDNFVGRIYLETAVYPKANFVARPQSPLAGSPATTVRLTVSGSFTLHGVTHDVSVPLQVVQNGDRLEVAGSFQVHLNDYNIDVPSVPFTTAAPDGTVEIHLFLKRAP